MFDPTHCGLIGLTVKSGWVERQLPLDASCEHVAPVVGLWRTMRYGQTGDIVKLHSYTLANVELNRECFLHF